MDWSRNKALLRFKSSTICCWKVGLNWRIGIQASFNYRKKGNNGQDFNPEIHRAIKKLKITVDKIDLMKSENADGQLKHTVIF